MTTVFERCAAGQLSPEMALSELLIEHEDVEQVRALATAAGAQPVLALLSAHGARCAQIVAMLRAGIDSPAPAPTVEEGIAFCQRLFDWSVQQCEETSVAFHSLGSPELLRRATDEIVDVLTSWGLLAPTARVLDLGCGIGRVAVALAPHVARVQGIDVSAQMVAAARRRCADLGNVTNVAVDTCSGRDLTAFADASFDVVLAVDSVPYLVQSGMALVQRHFEEARRVLAPGGRLVILNFAYADDEFCRSAVAELAKKSELVVEVDGTRPFALWSGLAFSLRR